MNPIAKKLNSRRGASILIAMLLFLVCAFVGGAMLTSAYQNASRSAALRQEQQAYLAVSSAAQLLKDELVGGSIKLQDVTRTEYTQDRNNNWVAGSTTHSKELDRSYTGLLGALSQDALAIFRGSAPGSSQLSFDLTGHPELSGVQGELTMLTADAACYAVTALLRDEDGGNELSIYFTASFNNNSSSRSDFNDQTGTGYEEAIQETTVTWTGAVVRLTSIPVEEEATPWIA